MICELKIQNYILISELHLQLFNGLTVITGETGSGKSILIGALGMLSGDRSDKQVLREKSKKCIIEGVFLLPDFLQDIFSKNNLDFEEKTIIRREILPNGKSRIFINDTPSKLLFLKKISPYLVDIHGQDDNVLLKDTQHQIYILDTFIDGRYTVKKYEKKYLAYKKSLNSLLKCQKQIENKNQENELKKYQLVELQNAKLKIGEQEELHKKVQEEAHREEILKTLQKMRYSMEDGGQSVMSILSEELNNLKAISMLTSKLDKETRRLESTMIELRDVLNELYDIAEQMSFNYVDIDEMQNRLDEIYFLRKKHKTNTVEELLIKIDELSQWQDSLNEEYESLKRWKKIVKENLTELSDIEKELSELREKGSILFKEKILNDLKKLGLENSNFVIKRSVLSNFTEYGKEEFSFMFSANQGMPLLPISQTVSGGERSRFMLVVKKLISSNVPYAAMVFDEIDTGIAGKIANKVGEVLYEISLKRQVLAITHLAQTASIGNRHLRVSKKTNEGQTKTQIYYLKREERINEIAEMISGEAVSADAIAHAKHLLREIK